MGAAASTGVAAAVTTSSDADLKSSLEGLSPEAKAKLLAAITDAAAAPAAAATTQSAFVFVKPHANTEKVNELVKAKFAEVGITILKDGEIDGPTIDSKKLIDNRKVVRARLTGHHAQLTRVASR